MQSYELSMALANERVAQLRREADRARLARQACRRRAGLLAKVRRLERRRRCRRRPKPTTDALAARCAPPDTAVPLAAVAR